MSLLLALGADREDEARDASVAQHRRQARHPPVLSLADTDVAAPVDLHDPPALPEAARARIEPVQLGRAVADAEPPRRVPARAGGDRRVDVDVLRVGAERLAGRDV